MPRLLRCLLHAGIVALLPWSVHAEDVTLAWDPPPGPVPAGYRVRYRPIASTTLAERDAGRATSLRITTLVEGTTYEFHVVAYDDAGRTSAPSNPLRVTIGGSAAPPPTEPAPQTPPPEPPTTVLTPYFPGLAGGEPSQLEPYRAFLAVGAHDPTFSTRLSLANPASSPVRVLVYLRRDGDELSHLTAVVVPAFSHVDVDAASILGARTGMFSIGITANLPVGLRRTMTWAAGAGAHSAVATPTPSARWSFAAGTTSGQFARFYHLLNPGPALAIVSTTYRLPSGASMVRYHDLPPGTRTTIFVNHEDPELAHASVAAVVESLTGQPIVAEQALYLNGRDGYNSGHIALGEDRHAAMPGYAAGGRWLVVGGPPHGAYRQASHVVVANPSDRSQNVRLTVLGPAGPLASTLVLIPPQRRHDVDMGATFPGLTGTYSVLVEAVTGAAPLVVEQSIYRDARGQARATATARPAQHLPD